MKMLLRILCVWLAFTVEVRIVQASAPASPEYRRSILEEPTGCFSQDLVCAILNQSASGIKLNLGESRVYLGEKAAIVRLSAGDVRVVSGHILVEATAPMVLRSEFGHLNILSAGKLIVYKTKSEMRLAMISGSAVVKPLGESGDFTLSAGYEVALTAVESSGRASMELARPVNLAKLIRSWSHVWTGSKDQLQAHMMEFRPYWEAAVISAGDWHKGIIQRSVAQLADQRARKRAAKEQWNAESRKLLKLYRRKMYLEGQ